MNLGAGKMRPEGSSVSDLELRVIRTQSEMADALSVRRAVFIAEQGVSEAEEIDGYDEDPARVTDAVHVIAYLDGRAVATGRLLLAGGPSENSRIGRVAVLREYRGHGYGRSVMIALEQEARRRRYPGITLAAQLPVIPFYERLGYAARGEIFVEAEIEHRWMDRRF